MDKNKFWYLVGYSLKKRIKTKAFLISNIIIIVAMILLANIGNIISLFGGDTDSSKTVLVYDGTELDAFRFFEEYNDVQVSFVFVETSEKFDSETVYDFMREEKADIYIDFTKGESFFQANVFAKSFELTDEITLQSIFTEIRDSLLVVEHPDLVNEAIEYFSPVNIETVLEEDDSIEKTIGMVVSFVILIPIFFLTLMMTQFVGLDIIEEKSSRAIEVIISNVTPVTHFSSKIVSALLFLVVQSAVLLVGGLIGSITALLFGGVNLGGNMAADLSSTLDVDYALVQSFLSRIPLILLVTGLFALVGLCLYVVSVAVLSAMATSNEDFQTFQTPIMLCLLLGFYAAMFCVMGDGVVFGRILIYIPFTAPIVTPVIYGAGMISIWEALISFAILLVTDFLVIYFGIPLYKASILSYSQESFFKRIKRIIKDSKYVD